MLAKFYIIDKQRVIYLQDAESRERAIELFDDAHTIKHDIVATAKACTVCGGTPRPQLPDYMADCTRHIHTHFCSHTQSIAI